MHFCHRVNVIRGTLLSGGRTMATRVPAGMADRPDSLGALSLEIASAACLGSGSESGRGRKHEFVVNMSWCTFDALARRWSCARLLDVDIAEATRRARPLDSGIGGCDRRDAFARADAVAGCVAPRIRVARPLCHVGACGYADSPAITSWAMPCSARRCAKRSPGALR